MKSKKSFSSDVAKLSQKFIDERDGYQNFCYDMINRGYTPIFEWVSPRSRIVINYPDENLILLNVRNTVTGEYMSIEECTFFAKEWGVSYVNEISFQFDSVSEIIDACHREEGVEGYVVQFDDGNFVKFKTPWYMSLNRAVAFTRERDIANMVLDGTIDDYRSYLNEMNVVDENVDRIVNDVVNRLTSIMDEVENTYENFSHLPQNEFAKVNKGNPYFHLLMQKYNGHEVDYKKYFKKNFLKENYSLEQL